MRRIILALSLVPVGTLTGCFFDTVDPYVYGCGSHEFHYQCTDGDPYCEDPVRILAATASSCLNGATWPVPTAFAVGSRACLGRGAGEPVVVGDSPAVVEDTTLTTPDRACVELVAEGTLSLVSVGQFDDRIDTLEVPVLELARVEMSPTLLSAASDTERPAPEGPRVGDAVLVLALPLAEDGTLLGGGREWAWTVSRDGVELSQDVTVSGLGVELDEPGLYSFTATTDGESATYEIVVAP